MSGLTPITEERLRERGFSVSTAILLYKWIHREEGVSIDVQFDNSVQVFLGTPGATLPLDITDMESLDAFLAYFETEEA